MLDRILQYCPYARCHPFSVSSILAHYRFAHGQVIQLTLIADTRRGWRTAFLFILSSVGSPKILPRHVFRDDRAGLIQHAYM